MLPRPALLLLLLALPVHCREVSAQTDDSREWRQWRGPSGNGSAQPDATPPLEWSAEQGILWKTPLPGSGSSTPVVTGGRVFVLSAQQTERRADNPPVPRNDSKTIPPQVWYRFIVTCLDLKTGAEIWRDTAAEAVPHEGHHPSHSFCGGSPVTDGERLYVSFGSWGLFCYSLDGKKLWETDLGDMHTRFGWGEAVTPTLVEGRLIVPWDQEEGAFITALDCESGKPIWKTARPAEKTTWTTASVVRHKEITQVVLNGSGAVRAYDADTGHELWHCPGQTTNAVPSVISAGDSVIALSGYRGAFGCRIPLGTRGRVSADQLTWTLDRGTPYVPSPALSGNHLFFTAGLGNILTVVDADSGRVLTTRRLSALRNLYASPVAAAGRLYFVDRDGTCEVIEDDEGFSTLAVNRLDDPIDASPVVVGSKLLLRSHKAVYCIETAAE